MGNRSFAAKLKNNPKGISYLGLIFVVLIWGLSPLLTLYLYDYYSATFMIFVSDLLLIVIYMLISRKKLKFLNARYFKIGIFTGLFYSLANILQKIGLQYTTPAKYAFLENLSCITVPVLMYFFVKKKPSFMTIFSCMLCLVGVFVLNGVGSSGGGIGIGEILCALAGLFYGVNIAGTGAYAKELDAPLYLMVQSMVSAVMSLAFALVLNFIGTGSSSGVVEKIVFSFNPLHILFLVAVTLVVYALCWIIRTKSMKHVDATVVAIIMPFSAVVTGVASVLLGKDTLSLELVIGGLLVFAAIIISGLSDAKASS